MAEKIQILIVEDHTLLREGIVAILQSEPGFEVVGQGGSAEEAMRMARQVHPDLILMDMDMPVNGIAIAQHISSYQPQARFLFLTISGRDDCPVKILTTGERAYILQNVASQDFFHILKAVSAGEPYLPAALAASLLCENSASGLALRTRRDCRNGLTGLEQRILQDLAAGLSISEVGLHLRLPGRIVKQSIARILRKRRVHSRIENTLIVRCGKAIQDNSYLAIEIGKRED